MSYRSCCVDVFEIPLGLRCRLCLMFVLERHFLEKSFDFVESNNPLLYNADLIFAASVTRALLYTYVSIQTWSESFLIFY